MIVRAIDASGDWLFGKGQNDYKRNNQAIAQSIRTRLMSFLGDCFFATTDGIDWFNLLGAKNQVALQLAISAVILNTQNVTGILMIRVQLDEVTRLFSIQYRAQTTYSTTADTFTYDLGGLV
jgi:hypothetical protein